MSRQVLGAGLRPVARRAEIQTVRQIHRFPTGGLLRADAAIRATQRRMWNGGSSFHNAVAVRNVSFARLLPKLVLKAARIPALFGGLTIAGFAWVQYQANREFNTTRVEKGIAETNTAHRRWYLCDRRLQLDQRQPNRYLLDYLWWREGCCRADSPGMGGQEGRDGHARMGQEGASST